MEALKKILVMLLACLLLAGCASGTQAAPTPAYRQISQEQARSMMAEDDGHLIVDVRRYDEYESGHIPGAICIPNESIGETKPEELLNPNQTLLIYCRTGNRSKQAAEKLAQLGYTAVYEFGGIVDWTGEVASGQSLALTVESNPTTGYSWSVEQEGACFAEQSVYVAAPQDAPVAGAGGWQSFLFTPIAPGEAVLRFRYARPWESNDDDIAVSVRLSVSEALQIIVLDDGTAQWEAAGYPPRLRVY